VFPTLTLVGSAVLHATLDPRRLDSAASDEQAHRRLLLLLNAFRSPFYERFTRSGGWGLSRLGRANWGYTANGCWRSSSGSAPSSPGCRLPSVRGSRFDLCAVAPHCLPPV
jgi:hypothetical protein